MNLNGKTTNEKINLAISKNCSDIWKSLVNDVDLNVRKAVASNHSVPSHIINQLLFDPTANVSYIARSNPNCTEQRVFSEEEYLALKFG